MVSSEMIDVMGPALAVGLMISMVHAPLGLEVLKRGIVFIDLAVAQIAALGLVATTSLVHEPSPWLVQVVALTCALSAGFFFRRVEKAMPELQEAVIGSSFVVAACLSILLLADHPHGGDEIRNLLAGQVLFVTWGEIFIHAPVYVCILAVWLLKPALKEGLGFYIIFAAAITSSVQLCGAYVVFASLILPALAAARASKPLLKAWLCGGLSVSIGIGAATWMDLPAGPLLVVCYALVAVVLFNLGKFPASHS